MRSAVRNTLALLLLQGCVPATFVGYMPAGSGQAEKGDHCSTIRDALTFKVGDKVDVTVRVPKDGMPSDLEVSFFVPVGNGLKLLSTELVLESPDWSQPQRLLIEALGRARHTSDLAPTDEMRGERHVNYTAWGSVYSVVDGSRFWLNVRKERKPDAAASKVRTFTVRFPEISIDGRKQWIKPLPFVAYEKVGLAGLCN